MSNLCVSYPRGKYFFVGLIPGGRRNIVRCIILLNLGITCIIFASSVSRISHINEFINELRKHDNIQGFDEHLVIPHPQQIQCLKKIRISQMQNSVSSNDTKNAFYIKIPALVNFKVFWMSMHSVT